MSLAMRPYQEECIAASKAAEARGVYRQLIALPTGTGKTLIFVWLIHERGQRTLILVHRDELVNQTLDKLAMVSREHPLRVGVVKAERDEHAGDVVVASVQTLQREARLKRIDQPFKLLIVDEAHHALPDNSYGRILDHFRAFHDGPLFGAPLTIGYTATPFRPDNSPMVQSGDSAACFQEIVYSRTLLSMINDGYLAPIVAKGIFIKGLNLDQVRVRGGDYVESDLEAAMIAADAPEHLVRGYQELAQGRRAAIFCPTVAMTQAVREAFQGAGLRAATVVGETPTEARQVIYHNLRTGNLDALCSCMVLTEGFDEPSIDCIMMARPTRSKVLFFQTIGRGLRLWPSKADCLVIDATGATARHGLLSVAAQLGLLTQQEPGRGGAEAVDPDAPPAEKEEKETGYHAHDINLGKRTPLHWVETPAGYFVVSLAGRMLRVRGDSPFTYRLEVRHRDEHRYTTVVEGLSQEWCFGVASDTARDAQLLHLVKAGAQWRHRPANANQLKAARSLGIQARDTWTSGEVSDAITRVTGDWYA